VHLRVILRITGILLTLFSLALLVPIIVATIYGEDTIDTFVTAFAITALSGLALWIPNRGDRDLRAGDGFMITALFYVGLGLFGALPIYLAESTALSFTDAAFESLSGLTTTGATVMTGRDDLPKSILFYRQLLQWYGGMGIIVLAIAILPMLGIGGMQLYRAESPGPVKDTKLTPRIAETAKALWYLYLGLTIACAASYWAAGMSLFDAICHSFSTVAIGGFSTHDASIGHFDSAAIDGVASVFMVIAGVNFALHFTAWQRRSPRHYLADPEFRFYAFLLGSLSLTTISILYITATHQSLADATIKGLFQVVSIATTTGFVTDDFSSWPLFLPYMLLYAAIIGACAGSTGGGIKVVRILLIFKQGFREVQRLIHPKAVIPIKLGDKRVPDRVIESVWGFFAVYVMVFMLMLLALLASGVEIITAFSAVGACINNLGPGLEGVATTYQALPVAAKWILCVAMLLGRLEVFTLLVLFTPMFWRR